MSVTKGIAAASAVFAMFAISTVAQAEAVFPASRLALSAPVSVAQVPAGVRVGQKQAHESKAVSTGVVVGVLAAAAAVGGIVAATSGKKNRTSP